MHINKENKFIEEQCPKKDDVHKDSRPCAAAVRSVFTCMNDISFAISILGIIPELYISLEGPPHNPQPQSLLLYKGRTPEHTYHHLSFSLCSRDPTPKHTHIHQTTMYSSEANPNKKETQRPVPWSTGLCDCFHDWENCMYWYFFFFFFFFGNLNLH